MKKIAIFISGKGTNMESLIRMSRDAKLAADFFVLSDKPDAGGVKTAANLKVPVHLLPEVSEKWEISPRNEQFIVDLLESEGADYILLAGFMKIITKRIIEKFRFKIVNIHPSLLPSFRGKDAQKQAFEYGVKLSGCTVHFIDERVDTGPIILQTPVDISDCRSVEEVKEAILRKEHETYFAALKILLGREWKVEGRRVIVYD